MLDLIELAGWTYEPAGDRGAAMAYLVDTTGCAYVLPNILHESPAQTAFRYYIKLK
jgi:hypothetical protein